MTLRATGAAVRDPPPPFSTSTATAIRGSSAGAKAMKSAWSRRCFSTVFSLYLPPRRENTCAVPVFPAIR